MKRDQPNPFDAMRAALRGGVQAVAVPQLFETPRDLAARAAELASIERGMRVLEPSAGTGRLLDAILAAGAEPADVTAVEISDALASRLRRRYALDLIRQGDFLAIAGELPTFDRVVMNPPFVDGVDVRHILTARALLAAGGQLVAFCADGPRQRRALEPIAESWESVAPGAFRGTNVRAALVSIGPAVDASPDSR